MENSSSQQSFSTDSTVQPVAKPSRLKKFGKRFTSSIITLLFAGVAGIFVLLAGAAIVDVVKMKNAEFFPLASDPVARFLAKIDWEKRTIELDGSMSKTYNNKVDKYIWRIDDGSASAEGNKFVHSFQQPGVYQILLSVVDTNGQSDQADCRVIFPPNEVEQIVASERVDTRTASSDNSAPSVKETTYKWIPKGTFFNYSKLSATGVGDLRSPYVETGCGFSNNTYNSYDVYQSVSDRNMILRRTSLNMTFGIGGILFVGVLYMLVRRRFRGLWK